MPTHGRAPGYVFWPLAVAVLVLRAVTEPPAPLIPIIAAVSICAAWSLSPWWAAGIVVAILAILFELRAPLLRAHRLAFSELERRLLDM